jgi:hypothetical protein
MDVQNRRMTTLSCCHSRQLDHLQQHGFAGIDELFQRDAMRCVFALRCGITP